MIRSWQQKELQLDYSSMYGDRHPSDIDMFYIKNNGTIIFGEIKNESYNKEKWARQRKLFEYLIDNIKVKAIYILITHDKYVQKGDKQVDIPNCYVSEYYYKGNWYCPKKLTKVKDVLKDEVNN